MPNADKSPFITSGEKFRNYLLVGFVLSLFIHALVAPLMKNFTQQQEDQQVEKVSVTKRIIVKPPTPPPPTPTPPPPKTTPPPKQQVQQPQPQLKVQPPKTTSNSSNTTSTENKYVAPKSGSESGVPSGQGTAAPVKSAATPGPPASTPTPKPACANPYQEATATNPVTPDYPDQAREAGMGKVVVNVVVSLSASGAPTAADVQNSSGNGSIDRAAKQAAMQSTYAPKLQNCVGVPSQYIYTITFDPNS